jgi:hypothetical protein
VTDDIRAAWDEDRSPAITIDSIGYGLKSARIVRDSIAMRRKELVLDIVGRH